MICPSCGHRWTNRKTSVLVSDDEFRQAIEEAHGNVSEAARRTGIRIPTAQLRAVRLGIKATGHKMRRSDIADAQIMAAFNEALTVKGAALILSLSYGFVYNRLKEIPEYRDRRAMSRHGRRQASAKRIADAVAAANGNMSEAALILGLTRQRVSQIWNRDVLGQPEDSE